MSDKHTPTAKAEAKNKGNQKVNLSQMQSKLSRKGKPAYRNEELAKDILSLDPTNPDDAFVWSEAKVSLVDSKGDPREDGQINKDKMRYRQRAISVAKSIQIEIRVIWSIDGEMIIALKK